MTNGILMREEVFREVRFNRPSLRQSRGTKVSDMEGSKTYESLEGQPLSSPD